MTDYRLVVRSHIQRSCNLQASICSSNSLLSLYTQEYDLFFIKIKFEFEIMFTHAAQQTVVVPLNISRYVHKDSVQCALCAVGFSCLLHSKWYRGVCNYPDGAYVLGLLCLGIRGDSRLLKLITEPDSLLLENQRS